MPPEAGRSLDTYISSGVYPLQAAKYGDELRVSQRKSSQLHRLWAQRDSKDMDAVYSQLLKSGRGSVKRHYELTGALADAELSQNPEAARTAVPLLRAVEASRPHAQGAALPPPTTSPVLEGQPLLESGALAQSANAPP